MIIVSQDKETIINFDNIENIHIFMECISINYPDNDKKLIGMYKTEERAKEVFQEIVERYTNWENLKVGQPSGICSPKYEMPEE